MAIQVSGTTVIDDSRNLVNVIGLKTVNSTSLLGAGDIAAGAPTTYNAVGTYAFLNRSDAGLTEGTTYAGSAFNPAGIAVSGGVYIDADTANSCSIYRGSGTVSGTWRAMGRVTGDSPRSRATLLVRTV